VLAKCGIQVLMSDLFGLAGTALLDDLTHDGRCRHRMRRGSRRCVG